jgi:hypothetical protein
VKRISIEAYAALREALSVVTWNKRPFESMLRTALRDSPELLVGLNFADPKRMVVDSLVDRLVSDENRWQSSTLQLMVEIGSMQRFPNLEAQEDSEFQISRANAAVAQLKLLTKVFAADTAAHERLAAQRKADAAQAETDRIFAKDMDELRDRYTQMQSDKDAHKRGRDLEKLMHQLFVLFDMEPRMEYSLEREQIDGSLTFDTDDYVLECKWWKDPLEREAGDVFASKVRRKGKNALGLLVSISGFTKGLRDEYSQSTPFITLDGSDLYYVLDRRIRLDDLMRAKRRHANETGSCFMPAEQAL